MQQDEDVAGRGASGRKARIYRTLTLEERAVHRKWMRGVIVFYALLFLIGGGIATASYSAGGLTRIAALFRAADTTHQRTN
jgi:hypothetical protein